MPHNVKSFALFLVMCCLGTASAQEADIDDALEQQSATNEDSQQSQQLINSLDEEISEDIADNRIA